MEIVLGFVAGSLLAFLVVLTGRLIARRAVRASIPVRKQKLEEETVPEDRWLDDPDWWKKAA